MRIAARNLRVVVKTLEKNGVLLQTDPALPNVASLLAGEQIKGSWWVHSRAHEIFAGLNQLADHEDVLITKLVSGKVTLVHRRLWPDFLSIATARESWQRRGLSPAARFLLQTIDREGLLRSNEAEWPKRLEPAKLGTAARELEVRLLVHSEEFHTNNGAHAKLLEAWKHWAEHVALESDPRPPDEAKEVFEKLMTKLNDEYRGQGRLPWLPSEAP